MSARVQVTALGRQKCQHPDCASFAVWFVTVTRTPVRESAAYCDRHKDSIVAEVENAHDPV